jgi:antirestriction protein
MSATTDTTRIYVASLSDYNAGRLHGCFIDLADCDDTDDIYEKVNAMLAKSPEQAQTGWKAEEWAIHDYEGFGGIRLSEYESFDRVLALANLIEEHGLAFAAWYGDQSRDGMDEDDLRSEFEEAYAGEWDSEKAFAENFVEDCGWQGLEYKTIEQIESYLDWDKISDELFMTDYRSEKTADYNVWVFRNY